MTHPYLKKEGGGEERRRGTLGFKMERNILIEGMCWLQVQGPRILVLTQWYPMCDHE